MKLFFGVVLFSASYLFSTGYDWNVDMDGNWTDPSNWNIGTGYPGSSGTCCDTATFPNILSMPVTITLDMDISNCANISFASDQDYEITGSHTFNFTPFFNELSSGSGMGNHTVNCMSITLPGTSLTSSCTTAGTTLTIASPISETSAGASISIGGQNGVVVLSGMNSYTGGTTVAGSGGPMAAGSLSVSSGANLADGTGGGLTLQSAGIQINGTSFTYGDPVKINDIGAGSPTITVNSGSSATFNGVISEISMGTELSVPGSGTLTLAGANTYTGPTTVSGGELVVNGSLQSATTTVNGGATLKGIGTLQAVVVESGGTIAAGNSIGNMTMMSFSPSAGANTQVEINPTTSSTYTIMNNADLNGNIVVVQDGSAGSYPSSMSYTFLTAGSITTGSSFSGVQGGLPGFTFTLVQDATSVTLEYSSASPFPIISKISLAGLSGNPKKFAKYLNDSAPNSPATLALAQLSGAALKNALNSASPARNAFGTYITQNIMFGVSQLVSSHLIDQRFFHTTRNQQPSVASLFADNDDTHLTADAGDCCNPERMIPDPCDKYSVWLDGFGEYSHLKAQDQNPSFNAYSGAAMMGFDFYGADHNLFGLGAGYAYTHLIESSDAGREKINYYFANLYDTVYYSRGYLEFGAWGVYNQIHNYRNISFPGFKATASATIHSWQLVPHFGFGVSSKKYCWGNFEPFAQFDCAVNWQQSFKEHGAGFFDMSQKARTSELLRSEAGFRFYESRETCWGAWMIMEKISYVNLQTFNTGDVTSAIVGASSFFTLENLRGTQNLGSAGLEFLWRFGKRKPVTFSLVYDGEWGGRYMSHEGMIKLVKDF